MSDYGAADPGARQRAFGLRQVRCARHLRGPRLLLRRQPARATAARIGGRCGGRRQRAAQDRGRHRRAQPRRRTRPTCRPRWRRSARMGFDPRLVFFDAPDTVLLKRYADTRRRHPLSQRGLSLPEAIALERDAAAPAAAAGRCHRRHQRDERAPAAPARHHRVRPWQRSGHVAAVRILRVSPRRAARRRLRVRCTRAAEPALGSRRCARCRAATRRCSDYLRTQEDVEAFYVGQIRDFLDTWLPRLQSDSTRSYATVAFGCTGGRHRSVYLAERMAAHARDMGWREVAVHHRELD